jgi:AcrR family transcriptional regulator
MPKVVDHSARRHVIALAACRAIAKYGLDSVTLVDIAGEAGQTTGMLAHYYKTKWDLILAALRLMHVRLESRLSERLEKGTGLIDLLQDALPIEAEQRSETAAWLTFWSAGLNRPDLLKWSAKMHTEWRSLIKRCLLETTPSARQWPEDLIDNAVSSIVIFMDGIHLKAMTRSSIYTSKVVTGLLRSHIESLILWSNKQASMVRRGQQSTKQKAKALL